MALSASERRVPIDLSLHPPVISQAFEILYGDVVSMMPALAALPLETELWQRTIEKLIDGYALGIRDAKQLADHGKLIFPTGMEWTAH